MEEKYKHQLTAAGRVGRLSPEERKAFATMGGKAGKGVSRVKYKRCDDCGAKADCEFVRPGDRCQIEEALRAKINRQPSTAFIELGFDSPKKFFAQLAKDVMFLRQSIKNKGNSPAHLMAYIDRMIAIAKLIYGEKHLNINVNAGSESKVLDLEKILLDARKKVNYNPKTGEMGPEVIDAEFEVDEEKVEEIMDKVEAKQGLPKSMEEEDD